MADPVLAQTEATFAFALIAGLFIVPVLITALLGNQDPTIEIDERQALGVVAEDGSREAYGTTEEPSSVDRSQIPDSATTHRFEIGTRLFSFETRDGDTRIVSRIVVTVEDPEKAWQAAPALDQPVRSLVEAAGSDATLDDQVVGDLEADRLAKALGDAGLSVLSTEAQRSIEPTYELELDAGDWYEVTVSIDEAAGTDDVADWDEFVLPVLRDALAAIDDEQLGIETLADQLDDPAIDIEAVSSCDSPADPLTERETES